MLETKDQDSKETWVEVPEDVRKGFLALYESEGILIRMKEGSVLVCITPDGKVKRKIIYRGEVIIDTFDPIGQNDGMDIVRFLATVNATRERASEVLQDIDRRIGSILDYLRTVGIH